MSDIFISHSKADHALALKLSAFLEAEGWTVWWDKSLAAADLYREEIMQQLAAAKRIYKLRWRIESAFNRLKDFRRIATRYDRLAHAAALVWWI
jgi:transposase